MGTETQAPHRLARKLITNLILPTLRAGLQPAYERFVGRVGDCMTGSFDSIEPFPPAVRTLPPSHRGTRQSAALRLRTCLQASIYMGRCADSCILDVLPLISDGRGGFLGSYPVDGVVDNFFVDGVRPFHWW